MQAHTCCEYHHHHRHYCASIGGGGKSSRSRRRRGRGVAAAATEAEILMIVSQHSALLYMRHKYGTCILQHHEQNRYYLYNLNMQLSTKVLLMSYLDITDD